MSSKNYGVPAKSAIRALMILEYFEEMQSPLSLKAITDHFELAASSASALLKNLAALDYLTYDIETRTYLPTLRLSRLGNWVEQRVLDEGLRDLVRRLSEATHETVVMVTLNDLYVDFLYFDPPSRYYDEHRHNEPLSYPRQAVSITCPFSWYLLKDYPLTRLESYYYRSKAKKLFDPAQLSWPEFVDQIEACRRSEYLVIEPWPFPATAAIATLVPVLPFGRRLALGVGAPADRMRGKLSDILDALDAEFAKLREGHRLTGRPDGEILHRLLYINLKAPLFASEQNVPHAGRATKDNK